MKNSRALRLMLIMSAVLLIAAGGAALAQQPSRDESPPAIYVIGYVVKPQAIPFKPSMTISQAVAMVGGVLTDGGMERVRILHPIAEDKTRKITIVDLKAISKQKAVDTLLQPYDIVEVLSKESSKRRKKECPKPPCYSVTKVSDLPLHFVN